MALTYPRLAYRRRLPIPYPEVEPELPEGEIPPLVSLPSISPLSPPLDTGLGDLPFLPPALPELYPYESGLEPATIRPAEEAWRPGGAPPWLRELLARLGQRVGEMPTPTPPEPGIDLAEEQAKLDALRRRRQPLEPRPPSMPPLLGGLGERLGGLAEAIGKLPTPSPFAPSEAMTFGELGGAIAEPAARGGEWLHKKVTQPAGGAFAIAGLGVSPHPEIVKADMARRVKEHMAQGKNLWEALGAAQEERPEFYAGEKFIQEFLADPLNLIGLGWEPKVARTIARSAEALATTVPRAGKAIARSIEEVLPEARRVLEEEAGGIKVPGQLPKEPWEMTQRELVAEYRKTYRRAPDLDERSGMFRTQYMMVKERLEKGLPVSPKVLADYPDLVARQAEIARGQGEMPEIGIAQRPDYVRSSVEEFLAEQYGDAYVARLDQQGLRQLLLRQFPERTFTDTDLESIRAFHQREAGRGEAEILQPGAKISRFGERLATEPSVLPSGEQVSADAQEVLRRNLATYQEKENATTIAKAQELLATDREGLIAKALDPTNPLTTEERAANILLVDEALNAGDIELAQDLARPLTLKLTASGQDIQIASIVKRYSPQAILHEFNRTVNAYIATEGEKGAKRIGQRLAQAEAQAIKTKVAKTSEGVIKADVVKEQNKIISDAQAMAKFQLEEARAARDIARANWQEAQRTLRANLRTASQVEQDALRASWREQNRLWKEAEKRHKDMEVLTGKMVPEAIVRAKNLERRAITSGKQAVAKNGLALPPTVASNFMERARQMAALEPGFQQNRLYRELMHDISNFVPPSKWDIALDIYGVSPFLKTMWDAGVMFRQAALLGLRRPDIWLDTWGPLIKSYADPAYAKQLQDQIATKPLANVINEAGAQFDELWERTEFFFSETAKKLPGAAGSQRSFTVPMNKIRWDNIERVFQSWLPKGYDIIADPINTLAEFSAITGKPVQEAKDMALLYNNLSGKTNIPWLKAQVGILRLPFFAAGWALSIPEAVGRTVFSPGARKEGARVLGAYYGFVTGAEMMGDLAGIWDAELDPRSTNFGKVRFKGTQEYIDPTLGLAAWLRLVAQIVPTPGPQGWQPYRKTATGKLVPQPWQDALFGRFLRGKSHPYPGELWSWAEGQNIVGEKRVLSGVNAETALSVLNTAKSLFAPLTPENIIEGVINDGLLGGVLSLSNIVGLNVQSYETFRDQQQKATDILFPGKKYEELDKGAQRQVNDSSEIKIAIEQMNTQGNLAEKVRGRYENYNEAKRVLEIGRPATPSETAVLGLRDYITAGMVGKPLTEKIKDFKRDRYKLAQAMLTPDVLAYSTQDKEIKPHDIYAELWLNVPLEENLQTGELDYEKQTAERDRILREAQPALTRAGRTSDYITKRGVGTFRGKSAEDPIVAKAVDEYDTDMEILKPYWELPGALEKGNADFRSIAAKVERLQATHKDDWERYLTQSENIVRKAREKAITDGRDRLRRDNAEIERILQTRLEYKPIKSSTGARPPASPRGPLGPR